MCLLCPVVTYLYAAPARFCNRAPCIDISCHRRLADGRCNCSSPASTVAKDFCSQENPNLPSLSSLHLKVWLLLCFIHCPDLASPLLAFDAVSTWYVFEGTRSVCRELFPEFETILTRLSNSKTRVLIQSTKNDQVSLASYITLRIPTFKSTSPISSPSLEHI